MKIANFKFQIISSGVTLVELLIVIAIMSIILGLAIPTYNTFNRKQTLRQSGETLIQALRDAQNRATSGDSATLCDLVFPAPSPGVPLNYPFLGWAVVLQSGAVNGKTYTITGKCQTAAPNPPVDKAAKTNQQFAGASYISAINPNVSPIYILFEPVSQAIKFYNSANLDAASEINTPQVVITLTQDTQTYNITVTNAGAIYNSP